MKYDWKSLKVEQYRKLLTLGESPQPIEVVEILTGKKRSQLTLAEVNSFKIGDLTPPNELEWNKVITYKGVDYGRVDMASLSYGEFVDLLEYSKDLNKNLVEVVALMYRPIVGISTKDALRVRLANFLLAKTKRVGWAIRLLDKVHFELEEYDTLKCDLRHGLVKEFPAHTAHWCVSFFLTFSQQSAIDSLKSLLQVLKESQEKNSDQLTNKA